MKINKLNYDQISIGDEFVFERNIDEADVKDFARLTGDYNPLHNDSKYAASTEFGACIVPGMLASSLFSTLVGMFCPGEKALYLSQDLRFRNPIPLNITIIAECKVVSKFDAAKIIDLATVIKDKSGKIFVDGVAKVKVRE